MGCSSSKIQKVIISFDCEETICIHHVMIKNKNGTIDYKIMSGDDILENYSKYIDKNLYQHFLFK